MGALIRWRGIQWATLAAATAVILFSPFSLDSVSLKLDRILLLYMIDFVLAELSR